MSRSFRLGSRQDPVDLLQMEGRRESVLGWGLAGARAELPGVSGRMLSLGELMTEHFSAENLTQMLLRVRQFSLECGNSADF